MKKNNTRGFIFVLIILTVIISAAILIVSILSDNVKKVGSGGNDSEKDYIKLSDNIKYLVESADLEVKYISSDQRNVLYLIGSDSYYILQYQSEAQRLFLYEGEYTEQATSDQLKIEEAEVGNKQGKQYAENITSFLVDGANSSGYFADGNVSITIAVTSEGGYLKRDTINIQLNTGATDDGATE